LESKGAQTHVHDPRNAAVLVYVDGMLVPRDKAVVSVFDSGFVLGDGVWEGFRLVNGRIAFAEAHLQRLLDGAKSIELEIGRSKAELLASITALLARRRLPVTGHSVCVECKHAGNACVLVAHGTACLGPVTHGGCGALCPSFDRGCFGCFGPSESANVDGLHAALRVVDTSEPAIVRMLRTFNVGAAAFDDAARRYDDLTTERPALGADRP